MINDTLKKSVLHRVLERLPEIPENSAAEAVDRAEEYFLSQSKRNKVPVSAFYLWVELAVRQQTLEQGTASGGTVTSIKRGDTTVQYSDSGAQDTAMADLERRVLSYRVVRMR